MARILVAEDDAGTLRLLSVALQTKGYKVLTATDGATAWTQLVEQQPDVVISDVDMPGMTGFELLTRVREHAQVGQTPFILLTSLHERRAMRQGMTLGADDYITKPLRPREVLDAVAAQLNRQSMRQAAQALHVRTALSEALEEHSWNLQDRYEKRLARELSERWPGHCESDVSSQYGEATVLFADIRDCRAWLAQLDPAEMAQLLTRFYEQSGDTVHLFGASVLQFVGEGVLAVFADPEPSATAPHALRAIKAAFGLQKSASGMADFVQRTFPGRKLPSFDVDVALHGGPVAMMKLQGYLGGNPQLIPVGEVVVDVLAMQRNANPALGNVTVSIPLLRQVTGALRPCARYLLTLPNRPGPMDVCSVEPHGT